MDDISYVWIGLLSARRVPGVHQARHLSSFDEFVLHLWNVFVKNVEVTVL